MKKKLKVFLCDLTYDTIILVSDTIPINIGFIGSYSKKMFGEDISIELFKYPKEVIEQIKKDPPDVIGFSNYSWNSNLSEYVASIAKDINPNIITIQGGTNFPHQTNLQEISQREKKILPEYSLIKKEGPPHSPIFTVSLKVLNLKIIKAVGKSKQEAEKNAAIVALKLIYDK